MTASWARSIKARELAGEESQAATALLEGRRTPASVCQAGAMRGNMNRGANSLPSDASAAAGEFFFDFTARGADFLDGLESDFALRLRARRETKVVGFAIRVSLISL